MNKAKKLLAIVLAVGMLMSVVACGSSAPAGAPAATPAPATPATPATPAVKDLTQMECTLDFPSWQATEPGFAEFWAFSIGRFNEKYPKVKINLYQIPFSNYVDTLTTMFAAGTPPQITHIPSKNFNQFNEMGWFENLDSRFAETDIPQTWTKMQGGVQSNGGNYGLLLLGNAYSLFYNEKMLKDAGIAVPKTVDELKEAATKLTKKDASGNTETFGFGTTSITHSGVYTGATQFVIGAGSHWSKDGKLNFTDPNLIKGLNDFKYFFDNGLTPLGITEEQKRQYFVEGKIAMISDGPWVVSLINQADEAIKSNIKATTLPFATLSGAVSNSVHIPVAISDDEKALVWEFYKVLASDEAQTKYSELTNSPAPKAGAITDELAKKNPFLPQMAADANKAVSVSPPGFEKNYNEFTTLVIDALVNLTSDSKNTVEDMLKQLEKNIGETIG